MTSEHEQTQVIPNSFHPNYVILDLCTLYVVHKCTVQFMIVSVHAFNGMSVNQVYFNGTVMSLASYSVTHIFICLCFSHVTCPCLPCRQRKTLSFAASIHFAEVVKVCLTQPRRCPFTFHDPPAAHNLIRYSKSANVNFCILMFCFIAPSKPRHFVVNLSMRIIIFRH